MALQFFNCALSYTTRQTAVGLERWLGKEYNLRRAPSVKLWLLTLTPNFEEEEKNNKNNNRSSSCRPQQKSTHRLHQVADYQPGDCFKVSQCLAKNNMTVIPHPPYSSDLAPCAFFLFPKLKLQIKGQRFDTQ